MDSLLAIVQMPAGIPVATVAIGKPGATNAGILAAQILGVADASIAKKLDAYKEKLAKAWKKSQRNSRRQIRGKASRSLTSFGMTSRGKG